MRRPLSSVRGSVAGGCPGNPPRCPSVRRICEEQTVLFPSWPSWRLVMAGGRLRGRTARPGQAATTRSDHARAAPSDVHQHAGTTSPPTTTVDQRPTTAPTTTVTEATVVGANPPAGRCRAGSTRSRSPRYRPASTGCWGTRPAATPFAPPSCGRPTGGRASSGYRRRCAHRGRGLGGHRGINTLRFADAAGRLCVCDRAGRGLLGHPRRRRAVGATRLPVRPRASWPSAPAAGYALALVGSCQNGSCSGVVLERSPVGSDQWTVCRSARTGRRRPARGDDSPRGRPVVLGHDRRPARPTSSWWPARFRAPASRTYKSPCFSGLGGRIQATSSQVLWAVCPTGMMAQAFRSTDGGAQWSTLQPGELENSALLAPASDTTAVHRAERPGPAAADQVTGGPHGRSRLPVRERGLLVELDWFYRQQHGFCTSVREQRPAGWPCPNGPYPQQLWRSPDGGTTWSGPVTIG